MKNFRYLILAFITLGVVSCSGEDDGPSVETSNLAGEWQLEDMSYTGTSSFNFNGMSMNSSFTGELMESNVTVKLNSDNTYTSAGSYTLRLTTNTEGMTDVQEVPISNLDGSGTYAVNGNVFTTSEEDVSADGSFTMSPVGISEATITELTANRMVLSFDNNQVMTMNGVDMEINIEGVQILTR
ncbi:lipocalin family protein [Antarcticibacterium sp. 1MA-6-2]|uniref:lipocalin family protein n=1 Tax=Antarcticibacterium sp. 1MA-6-2 TaxID=2908210 RepID=UPI001F335AB0|nr:lipocalin family protein [Antarcticibacterium sp. 1MA-6-2]UJH91597.1 lipocalin family protein [Antarcticibacterium sp. 1MA-6-2]